MATVMGGNLNRLVQVLGCALVVCALPIASYAGLNQDFFPSASSRTSVGANPSSAKISKDELQKLQSLIRNVYEAESDGNTDEVAKSTENVRRFLIALKKKGVSLKVNPTQFSTTRDLTKKLDQLATTKVADLAGMRKIAHVCFVAFALVSGIAEVHAGSCNPSEANISTVDEINVQHAPGGHSVH